MRISDWSSDVCSSDLAADPALIDTIRRIVEAHPEISAINHVRTIHTAPDSIFVAVSADFEDELLMGQAEALIETIEGELKAASPLFSSIYIRPETIGRASCRERVCQYG